MRARLRARFAAWIRRRQGEDSPPLALERRRLYILPTRAGLGFGLLLLFMLVAGLNYANSLALFLTFLLAGFALVAMHQCHRNLLGIALLGAGTAPAFAGQPGRVHLLLGNDSALPRYGIEASLERAPGASADLAPRARARLELRVPTRRRGVLRIGRVRVATTHPFGLFRAWTWLHMPLELMVYPRPRGALPLPQEAGMDAVARGSTAPGHDEWLGLRAFREGDSPRQVAWKAYARGAPLLVKEYAAAGAQMRQFEYARLAPLEPEARLEQLARWIVDAETHGDTYGLRMPAGQLAPARGPEHRHRCLAMLARHGAAEEAHAGA